MAFQIVPSVDLRHGQVVRLQQGDYARQLNYDLDPVETARAFAAAGAQWMHIVDLDGAKEGRVAQADLIAQMIAATGLKVQVGGGIRSTEDVQQLLEAGAERAVVGTKAMEDWAWFEWMVKDTAFQQKIVLAIDAKEGVIATRGWTASAGRTAVEVAREVSDWPVAALLYTDVAKDGMLSGPNYEHTRKLAEATKVPVIASGGVGHIGHVRELMKLPVWGVIVGRSLHEGKLDLGEAVRVANGSEG